MADETPGNPQVLLRLPQEVGLPLLRDAKRRKITAQAIILEIVAAHYGVEVVPPKRGARKKATEEVGQLGVLLRVRYTAKDV